MLDEYGTFMQHNCFQAANITMFCRDYYKSRLTMMCESDQEGTNAWEVVKAKFVYWNTRYSESTTSRDDEEMPAHRN
jgi:hypothetical protein